MKRIFHEIVRFERKVPCNILIIILAILPLVYVYFHANSTANLRLPNIFELRNLKSLVPYDTSYVEEQEDIEVYQDEYNEDSDYYEELVEEETLNHEEDGEIEEVKENSVYDGDKLPGVPKKTLQRFNLNFLSYYLVNLHIQHHFLG